MEIFPRKSLYRARNGKQSQPSDSTSTRHLPSTDRTRFFTRRTPHRAKTSMGKGDRDKERSTATDGVQLPKHVVPSSPTSVMPPSFLPPDHISQILTSSAPQTLFEGNLYDSDGFFHDKPFDDKWSSCIHREGKDHPSGTDRLFDAPRDSVLNQRKGGLSKMAAHQGH